MYKRYACDAKLGVSFGSDLSPFEKWHKPVANACLNMALETAYRTMGKGSLKGSLVEKLMTCRGTGRVIGIVKLAFKKVCLFVHPLHIIIFRFHFSLLVHKRVYVNIRISRTNVIRSGRKETEGRNAFIIA